MVTPDLLEHNTFKDGWFKSWLSATVRVHIMVLTLERV
jgi:hypothetical protein